MYFGRQFWLRNLAYTRYTWLLLRCLVQTFSVKIFRYSTASVLPSSYRIMSLDGRPSAFPLGPIVPKSLLERSSSRGWPIALVSSQMLLPSAWPRLVVPLISLQFLMVFHAGIRALLAEDFRLFWLFNLCAIYFVTDAVAWRAVIREDSSVQLKRTWKQESNGSPASFGEECIGCTRSVL